MKAYVDGLLIFDIYDYKIGPYSNKRMAFCEVVGYSGDPFKHWVFLDEAEIR